jgi:hypothetical protein
MTALTQAHKSKIAAGLRAYHKGCKGGRSSGGRPAASSANKGGCRIGKKSGKGGCAEGKKTVVGRARRIGNTKKFMLRPSGVRVSYA